MDFKLSRSIYTTPWAIDYLTLEQYTKMLDFFRGGGQHEGERGNRFGILAGNGGVYTPNRIKYDQEIGPGSLAVYYFDSVITKYGGASHYGTKEIAQQFTEMEANENVGGHLFYIESGGGAVNAIKYIRDVAGKNNRKKPLVAFGEDIVASSALWISSFADYVVINSPDAYVGSLGVMMQFEGFAANTEDKTGKRHIRVYSNLSNDKNGDMENALNDFDFELIKSEMLDPHAKEFIADMKANRENITDQHTTGKIFRAENVVGSFVDEINTIDYAIEYLRNLSEKNNLTSNAIMTKDELKAQHPELYASIFEEGVTNERDRVEAHMEFVDVDPDGVKKAISEGSTLSQKQMAEYSKKMFAKDESGKHIEDNAEDVQTDEAKADAAKKAAEAELNNLLNLK